MISKTAATRMAIALSFFLISLSTAAGATEKTKQTRPMNVLFIVCDDLNNRLGCYGWDSIHSPNLDKLASESMRFDRAYCQYPVCNPSRSSFLTGLRPDSTKVLNNRIKLRDMHPNIVTLPECFETQGYWTGGVGKVFHGHGPEMGNNWNDYKAFSNARNPIIKKSRREFEAKHGSIKENRKAWRQRTKSLQKRAAGQTPAGYGPTDMEDNEHKDGRNVRQVVRWLKNKSYGNKPFFITCGIQKPHVPFWAPKKYFDLYPLDTIELAGDSASDWDDIPPTALWGRYKGFFVVRNPSVQMRREAIAAYHACVSFIDAQVGILFNTLKRQGLWDNTIILFTSDHGYHLGEHGMWGKVTLFEECARVPFIVHVPGVTKPGSACPRVVELVDIYPTLAQLCGLKVPDNLEGTSFVPLLTEPQRPWKRAAFTMVPRGSGKHRRHYDGVRNERWTYAEWQNPNDNELYDLANDPHQWTNLAEDPAYGEQVKKMRELLNGGWQKALPPGM